MSSVKKIFWKITLWSLVYYIVTMILLFGAAGTIHYPDAWNYIIITMLIASFQTYYFLYTNPSLVELRLKGEVETLQKIIQFFNTVLYVLIYILSGADFKYSWSNVPFWLQLLAILILIVGYVITFVVFKQNDFLASNIKVYENQKVVTTGFYAYIRHPMYSGAFLIVLATPLILGSYWTLIPAFIICVFIVIRAIDEERIMLRDLEGYREYMNKVKQRFIPGVI